jgi:ABC-type amino acid transport substrate-binding protein
MKTSIVKPLAIVALLLAHAAATSGSEQAAQEAAQSAPQLAAADNTRFGGYIFLDADGQPLPFQSADEVAEFLKTSDVASMKKIPVGVSAPKKLLLEEGGVRACAVFKDIDQEEKNVREKTAGKSQFYLVWRDWFGYDIAAYHVNRLLGLDRVPPVVQRKIKGNEGSVQIWLEGTITERERREKGFEPPDVARFDQQEEIMHVFDNLVANRDSNLGNTLIDGNWRVWFIDCSRCFGRTRALLYPEAICHCERGLWKTLQELDPEETHARLAPYLTESEIEALLMRRDLLVEHIRGLIDEWGESMIIFDNRPPSGTAPWVDD